MTSGRILPRRLPIHFLSGGKDGARPSGRRRQSRPAWGQGSPLPSSVPAGNPGRGGIQHPGRDVQLLEPKTAPWGLPRAPDGELSP